MLIDSKISILLVTGYSPRKDALLDLLQGVCGDGTAISSAPGVKELKEKATSKPELCLLDLANINQPSLEVIGDVKDYFSTSKIIAIHIYSSSVLVDPLFKAGIDGYLTYEPTRSSIKKAFDCVLSNQTYVPADIMSS